MAFCGQCGSELSENAKFCSECGALTALGESANAKGKRKEVYDGEIHKCPNCGEILESFMLNCPTCGHELRDVESANSVKEFAMKLESIPVEEKPTKTKGISERDAKKVNLIESFAIPNSKEDILEFMILAASNIDTEAFNEWHHSSSSSERKIANAWRAKTKQAYLKAKATYKSEPEFQRIQEMYTTIEDEISLAKKKSIISMILSPLIAFSPLIILLLIIGICYVVIDIVKKFL